MRICTVRNLVAASNLESTKETVVETPMHLGSPSNVYDSRINRVPIAISAGFKNIVGALTDGS